MRPQVLEGFHMFCYRSVYSFTKKLFMMAAVLLTFNSVLASISVQEKLGSGRSFWSFSYFGLLSTELEAQMEKAGRLSSYNYITAGHRFGNDRKFSVRLPFSYNSAGFEDFGGDANNEQELKMQDAILSLSDYNLILLPADIGVYWEGRVYLPSSESSQKIKMISRFRNDLIFSKYLSSQFVVEYVSKLNYYYQSQTAYKNIFTDENGFTVEVSSRTKKLFHDNWFSAWYRHRPGLSFGFLAGWEDTYYNKSDVNNGRNKPGKHEYKLGPQVAFELSSKANFIFQISDNVINDENRAELGKFKKENVQMTLLAFVRF